jgi:hypothetical protein
MERLIGVAAEEVCVCVCVCVCVLRGGSRWRAEEGKMKEESETQLNTPQTPLKSSFLSLCCLSLAVPTSLSRGLGGGFVRFT